MNGVSHIPNSSPLIFFALPQGFKYCYQTQNLTSLLELVKLILVERCGVASCQGTPDRTGIGL